MTISVHENIRTGRNGFSRRRFLHTVSASAMAAGTLSFRDVMSLKAEELRKENRSMILLWMAGGPSQFETFDPKPDHPNGANTKVISTSVPGIQIAEAWEDIAKVMGDITVLRSLTNKEGNHRRASYQMHTGYVPSGSVKHPSLASNIAKEIGSEELDLPSVVTIGRGQEAGAGFLGVDYEPFVVGNPGGLPDNVAVRTENRRYSRRMGLLDKLEQDFAKRGGEIAVDNHRRIYQKSSKMVLSSEVKAFDLNEESSSLRKEYGDNQFGKGCLLARRLVEQGVSFVEVRSNGWDTHADNFEAIPRLASQVGPATAALISDLKQRGMLENTLVVWMGEFGRTPRVNGRGGRDHYPRVFNGLMAGGGVKGGQVIGASTKDGVSVDDEPITVADVFQSVCHSLNVDPESENISPLGRPMKIVDGGKVIPGLFS